jgi:hypothetical protein
LPMQVCMITRKASGANTAVSLFRQAFIESLHA